MRRLIGRRLAVLRTLAVACVLLPLAAAAARAQLEAGYAAYEGGDFERAFLEWLPLAEAGHPAAQHNVGIMYTRGESVVTDDAEAARWYRRSAEAGFPPAQFSLGLVYQSGRGVQRDPAEAARWFRRAAERGMAAAQFTLGALYQRGEGVPQNFAESVRWYRRAAEQGQPSAQNNLSVRYARGEGVARDLVQAYLWTSLAAAAAPPGPTREAAERNGTLYAREMAPQDLARAKDLVRKWRPKPEGGVAQASAGAGDEGDRGRDLVRTAQGLLQRLGYDPGPADGAAGGRTRKAVQRFQARAGLSQDGRITPALVERLEAEVGG